MVLTAGEGKKTLRICILFYLLAHVYFHLWLSQIVFSFIGAAFIQNVHFLITLIWLDLFIILVAPGVFRQWDLAVKMALLWSLVDMESPGWTSHHSSAQQSSELCFHGKIEGDALCTEELGALQTLWKF